MNSWDTACVRCKEVRNCETRPMIFRIRYAFPVQETVKGPLTRFICSDLDFIFVSMETHFDFQFFPTFPSFDFTVIISRILHHFICLQAPWLFCTHFFSVFFFFTICLSMRKHLIRWFVLYIFLFFPKIVSFPIKIKNDSIMPYSCHSHTRVNRCSWRTINETRKFRGFKQG